MPSATPATKPAALPFLEFIILMALMMSLVALSIDAMLPALPNIGEDLGVKVANDTQLIVLMVFLGLAFGQLVAGPMADSFGRKPTAALGLLIFLGGCLLCIFSENFILMLCGRALQGIGLGAPRIVSMALVRDQYKGNEMAKVMSFIMTIFMFVPLIAPMLGQMILLYTGWRSIFVVFFVLGVVTLIWFLKRQPETLAKQDQVPFSFSQLLVALKYIISHKTSILFTLAAGCVSGPFLAYLSTSQQIFQVQYGLGELFPYYFAALAMSLASASYSNGRLVLKFGMFPLARLAMGALVAISAVFAILSFSYDGHPPFWSLMIYFAAAMFSLGILFGNLNSMAMEPLGKVAGVGASVIGTLSNLISIPLAIGIGRAYDGTVIPMVLGFLICNLFALVLLSLGKVKA